MKINMFLRKNSSTLLTTIGSVGVGITAVMSARDTVKTIKRLKYQEGLQGRELTKKEKFKVAAPCYIPTVLTGLSTILCICGAEKMNKNVQKSLTSAYVLLDQSYKEYKKSVTEVYGEDGEKKVISNIADKKLNQIDKSEIEGAYIFFDFFSFKYFAVPMGVMLDVEKKANEMLNKYGHVSLGMVYHMLGQSTNGNDELFGWSLGAGRLYGYDNIKFKIEEDVLDDGTKYYVMDFINYPTEDFLDY